MLGCGNEPFEDVENVFATLSLAQNASAVAVPLELNNASLFRLLRVGT